MAFWGNSVMLSLEVYQILRERCTLWGVTFLLVSELSFWVTRNRNIAKTCHSIPKIYMQTLSIKAPIKGYEEKIKWEMICTCYHQLKSMTLVTQYNICVISKTNSLERSQA